MSLVMKMEMQKSTLTLLKSPAENDVSYALCCESIVCCAILTMHRNTASASLRDQERQGSVGLEGSNATASSENYGVSLGQQLQVPSYKRPSS